jgi:glutathione S-transferase
LSANLIDDFVNFAIRPNNMGNGGDSIALEKIESPDWSVINELLRSKETALDRSDFEAKALGRGPTNHAANIRLFDAPEGTIPEVVLYRDTAGWCPYCQKVWMQLEEKRIPYKVEKVNMRCYGEKPRSFMQLNPSGA